MSRYASLFDKVTARREAQLLVEREPGFAEAAERLGPPHLPSRPAGGAFGFLVKTVVFQQLAIGAARKIHARLVGTFGEGKGYLEAGEILAAGAEGLAKVGLSRPKQRTLLSLATAVDEGSFTPRGLSRLPDDEVRLRIVALHGFGPWSAEIFLLFQLGRTDVLPSGDLGLRDAMAQVFGNGKRWSPAEVAKRADTWQPHRSTAALWLWHLRSGRRPGMV